VDDVSAETAEERPSWGARRTDALVLISESFPQHGAEALNGGDRQQIVLHVDVQTLRDGCAGRCEIEDGPFAAHTIRRAEARAIHVEHVCWLPTMLLRTSWDVCNPRGYPPMESNPVFDPVLTLDLRDRSRTLRPKSR
jgi:hypothetical protein